MNRKITLSIFVKITLLKIAFFLVVLRKQDFPGRQFGIAAIKMWSTFAQQKFASSNSVNDEIHGRRIFVPSNLNLNFFFASLSLRKQDDLLTLFLNDKGRSCFHVS